jgi:lysophospholipase L1-like esterase
MKKVTPLLKMIFWVSVILNILLLTLALIYLSRNSDKIRQKLILAKGNPELIMFGDSHTANAVWPSLLHGRDIIGMGYSGYTSDQLKNMLIDKVIRYKPTYCFIQGGGNDIRSRCYDKRILISNIKEMIDTLKNQDIQPVVQSLFYRYKAKDYNTEIDSINELLRELVKDEGIDFLDVNEFLSDKEGLKNELTLEGVHLNEHGYNIWAGIVRKYLDSKKNKTN